jgi:hypothetical protein
MSWDDLAQTYANLGYPGMNREGVGVAIAGIARDRRDRKGKTLPLINADD